MVHIGEGKDSGALNKYDKMIWMLVRKKERSSTIHVINYYEYYLVLHIFHIKLSNGWREWTTAPTVYASNLWISNKKTDLFVVYCTVSEI